MTRYMINFTIPEGIPSEALTLDDLGVLWQICQGKEDGGAHRTERAKRIIDTRAAKRPDVPLADILQEYFGSSGYTNTTDWTESPMDYQSTVQRLQLELKEWLDRKMLERQSEAARANSSTRVLARDLIGPSEDFLAGRWEDSQQETGIGD